MLVSIVLSRRQEEDVPQRSLRERPSYGEEGRSGLNVLQEDAKMVAIPLLSLTTAACAFRMVCMLPTVGQV